MQIDYNALSNTHERHRDTGGEAANALGRMQAQPATMHGLYLLRYLIQSQKMLDSSAITLREWPPSAQAAIGEENTDGGRSPRMEDTAERRIGFMVNQ